MRPTSELQTQPPSDGLLTLLDLEQGLERLASRSGVEIESIGRSVDGSPIWAVIFGSGRSRSLPDVEAGRPPRFELGPKPSLLLVGGEFGDEAAHVEGLLAVAEALADSIDAGDTDLISFLSESTIAIVPLINPDGRHNALAEWQEFPLASGSSGEGNSYSQIINRDFLSLSQPESTAVAQLLTQLDPIALWDSHEDAISLGVDIMFNCLAPPTSPSLPPLVPPEHMRLVDGFGAAIDQAWRDAGYVPLYAPDGQHGWPTARPNGPKRMTGFDGRLAYLGSLRGTISFITESARTPGSQSWQHRVDQKLRAALAVVAHTIETRDELMRSVEDIRQRDATPAREQMSMYEVQGGQDISRVARVLDVLTHHGISIFRGSDPTSFLVPRWQPTLRLIDVLLGDRLVPHLSLAAQAGVRIRRVERQSPGDWVVAHAGDWWRARGSSRLQTHQRPADSASASVALYIGQGTNLRQAPSSGSARSYLDAWGIDYVCIGADTLDSLDRGHIKTLIVADGDARMIIEGWNGDDSRYRDPWELPGNAIGIGESGCDVIRSFVEKGGRYIGIDGGGAWLATSAPTPLLKDLRIASSGFGLGRAEIEITDGSHHLFQGVSRHVIDDRHLVPILLGCEPKSCAASGSSFELGQPALASRVLAEYALVLPSANEQNLVNIDEILVRGRNAAIVEFELGAGGGYLFGFDPLGRCQWLNTATMISNALVCS